MTGLRAGTPAEAGLSAARLDHARDLAASWVEDGDHPALVVLVARHGVIALHEAFGQLGPEGDDPPLVRDALFPIASLTKPITATALMILVEDGRVGLTRRVCDYIPEFHADGRDEVYVHHLLTHTSGLESQGETLESEVMTRLESPPRNLDVHPIVDALLQIAFEGPLRKAPGEEMFYDSANYDLLGEIVRRAGGQSLRDFVHDRVFDPIGMTDSYMIVPAELTHRVVRAIPESPAAEMWRLPPFTFALGGGSCFATALDLARFGQMFLDRGRVGATQALAPATAEQMTTNQIPGVRGDMLNERHDEASWGYGWGIACHEKWAWYPTPPRGTFSHGGGSGVYLWGDPANDIVGAYFSAATKERTPDTILHHGDLFVNVVTAAIED
jgi:CubicO group peptidase (beta-lactamase class C family)